jgi:hypothetical protein
MARNVYFSHGTKNEQYLVEDLIVESLSIYGQDMYYIPRTLVGGKDEILGEDRLSKFLDAYPIEMYFENVTDYGGQGSFIQKFGLFNESSATFTVARRRWDQLIGRFGQTIIPARPAEGDLLYFPLTKGLFEIKFVDHLDPFFQLGKLYIYKLQVELFQYASETIQTGIPDIDIFEELQSYGEYGLLLETGDLMLAENGSQLGGGYGTDIVTSFGDNEKFRKEAKDIIFTEDNPFGDVL